MKAIVIIGACLALIAHRALSQGTINFSNRTGSTTTAAPGQVTAPVYGINPGNPLTWIRGNTATGIPAGNTPTAVRRSCSMIQIIHTLPRYGL
jgi:hypothetical protein